ncbi:hypothetical protein AAER19_26460 [Pseudomonas aeruginosa]
MTKANECTCPSGDGSLRHPCPAHPASVELAGVAANLTFINGRPAMCGCQVEYSSGGGEYSDVIYVTLCAKHSDSAILDLVATNRIALTPEYEGQWHADLYLDREIPLAKAEGATPAEAVLALMSAERIDPEQGGGDQAGGDRWDALQSIMEWTAAENIPDDRKLCLIRNAARAALAQPSPKCEFCGGTGEISGVEGEDDWVNGPCPRCAYPAQAEQAEAERPEVVAVMESNGAGGKRLAQRFPIVNVFVGDELMTVAQHAASVARWAEMFNRFEQERDAALSRVAELEKQEPSGWLAYYFGGKRNGKIYGGPCGTKEEIDRYIQHVERSDDSISLQGKPFYAAPVAQAQHSVPDLLEWAVDRWHAEVSQRPLTNVHRRALDDTWRQVIRRLGGDTGLLCGPSHDELLAAAPGKEVGHE